MSGEMPGLVRLTLQRIKQTDFATYGEIYNEKGRRECVTLEPSPTHGKGCIPAGQYIAERRWSPKHSCVVFGLLFVPGFTDVEIHIGNLPCDTEACLLVGVQFGYVEKKTGEKGDGVQASATAFHSFMADHPEQRFWLTVLDPSPSLPEHPL